MIIDTLYGDPVVRYKDITTGGKKVPAVICNDRTEYGFKLYNMTDRKLIKMEISNEIIFEDFILYYGKEAYNKLKEIGFKFK